MKEKIVYIWNRIVYVFGITTIIYLIYTFLITLFKVKFMNGALPLLYPLKHFYFNSWFLLEVRILQLKPAFWGQQVFEIILFTLPAIICIAREVYIRRDKIFKNYDNYKQKKEQKQIEKLEQQLKELKKEKH